MNRARTDRASSSYRGGIGGRVGGASIVAVLSVAALLGVVAAVIGAGQSQQRGRISSNFAQRGANTAALAADYLEGLAQNERTVAEDNLGGSTVSDEALSHVAAAFGFSSARLYDDRGMLLASDPDVSGDGRVSLARGYLAEADARGLGVSNVTGASPGATGGPVVSVAVSFASPAGRRIFDGSFPLADVPLQGYLREAVVSAQHSVFLVDGTGRVIAADPSTAASTLAEADARLARACAGGGVATYASRWGTASCTVGTVAGTTWRVVLGESNAALYRTTLGVAGVLPWVVFAALCALALALLVVFLRSVRDRRMLTRLSVRMTLAAETDELTGLANRRRLVRTLEAIGAGRRAGDAQTTIALIDVDRFKLVNDTYGHTAGDDAIVMVADVMRETFREDDVIGRWGGDEFVAILHGTAPGPAREIGERFRAELARRSIDSDGRTVRVTASVGVATGGRDLDDLLRRADLALYRAKDLGGDAVVLGDLRLASEDAPLPGAL